MTKRREIYAKRIILSFILTNIIFISIFSVTFTVSYLNYKQIRTQNNLIQVYITETEKILEEATCDGIFLAEASQKIDDIASRMSNIEEKFGKKDSRVLEQKKLYTNLELKHFALIKKFESDCNVEFIPIFFFYSNEGESEKSSERVGLILSTFKKQNPSQVMVYSFDYNLNESNIDNLKREYNLTSAPIVVVNETDVFHINNINDLADY